MKKSTWSLTQDDIINMFSFLLNNIYVMLQVAQEKLAAGARKFILIKSYFSISIWQMMMKFAENNHPIMVITFTKYYDSQVNRTWDIRKYQN